MELNADFSQRVAVHAARLPWVASPIAAVERRMLDRIGDEVARATSIVRGAPARRFSAHTHGGGEEFLVLDGVFQDEHGDYPVGSYIRNPPTSRHTPSSKLGCVLFVKLWQFDLEDRTPARLDARALVYVHAQDRPGVEITPLFHDSREDVRMERWVPNTSAALDLPDGGEFLVIDVAFDEGGESFRRTPGCGFSTGGSAPALARSGCALWVKTGHLRHIRVPPAAGA